MVIRQARLVGSFRPPDVVIALRAYLRQRLMLISYASTHIQHMQKALEQMNVKLTEVVSDDHRADRHADHHGHPRWGT